MTSCAHTKKGSRIIVRPGARSWRIVTIILIAPTSDEPISTSMPTSHAVWPAVATSASGGYDVQPDCAAPPGRKKPASMITPAARYSQ